MPAETLVDALFAQAPYSVALYDALGRVAAANDAYERHWGIRRADIPPDYSLLRDPQLGEAGLLDMIRRAYAGEAVTLPPIRYDAARASGGGGRVAWTQAHCHPVRDADGNVAYVAIVHTDVTDRMEAEAALRAANDELESRAEQLEAQAAELEIAAEDLARTRDAAEQARAEAEALHRRAERSETLARQLFTLSPLPKWVYDAETLAFLDVNEAAVRHYGCTREEFLAMTIRDIRPPEEIPRMLPVAQSRHPTGASQGVFVHRTKAGELLDVEVFLRDVWYEERRAVIAVVQDVTARRRAEAALREATQAAEAARDEADLERRRLLAVLEQLPVGVHVADAPGGRLVLDNAAVRAICGEAPRSAGVGDYSVDYAGHYPPGHPRAGERLESGAWPLARALADGAPVGAELVEIRRADGTRRLVSVSATPVRDADGNLVGAVATNVDVTEREWLLAESGAALARAEAAQTEAEKANRAKSEFLAVMSHELRTPLNAIGGYAELLEMGIRGPVTAQQREDLRRLQASQRHLLGLINEVLNYARLETGTVHFDLAPLRVRDALVGAETLVAPQARARGLTLVVACPDDLVACADAEKLRQVLVNLLSNAVKFTDPGGRIELAGAAVGERLHVTVRDTGIGIAAEQHERIFDPFVQVRADLTRPHEGTGLGLAISRDLARGMGGDLTVESAPGVGSVFTLVLPVARAT